MIRWIDVICNWCICKTRQDNISENDQRSNIVMTSYKKTTYKQLLANKCDKSINSVRMYG